MTGVVFAHICKFKEINNKSKKKANELANMPCNFDSDYAKEWKNTLMLDHYASDRLYFLEPDAYKNYLEQAVNEFPDTVHLIFKPGQIEDLSAEGIAHLLREFGDFQVVKDTPRSCYFELFLLEKSKVPDKSPLGFIKAVMDLSDLGVESGSVHSHAPKFMSNATQNLE